MADRNKWEVVRELGEGGQGKVSLVRDGKRFNMEKIRHQLTDSVTNTHRIQCFDLFKQLLGTIKDLDDPKNLGALKELHKPKDARDPERAVDRIKKEMAGMQAVSHPNLLKIIESDDSSWFVSEYHPNGTLAQNPAVCQNNVVAALRLMRPVIDGVRHLHEQRLVHRDIKPHNLFFSQQNELVLGDFGLVYFMDDDHTRCSGTFENVGTKDWMPGWAWHQRIEEVNFKFDVFALGKVLWSLVVGRIGVPLWYIRRTPFNIEELMPDSDLAKGLNRLLAKCVVEEEKDCLPDAGALLTELDRLLAAIASQATLFEGSTIRRCLVCRVGHYEEIPRDQLQNYNLTQPSGSIRCKTFFCNMCGHLQEFYKQKEIALPFWDDLSGKRKP